ncbi:MAG TPA: PIN domain-containing protein [Verrucomicrobiae bacterium]|jgi:predicted nucleic acid-binding protein|nr:PIN domain-containing protein [Verrucomicrobiae bacterium]
MNRRIFLDASFWISRRDDREVRHREAVSILEDLAAQRVSFVSSTLVFAEVHARFSRFPKIRETVINDFWQNRLLHLEQPLHADHEAALKLLREYGDKEFSFCDAVSFVLMRRMKIREAAALDDHFHQMGEFEVWG